MGLEQISSSPPSAAAEPRSVTRTAENAAIREQLRTQSLARREQLYGAIRESLLRVGILAGSYKFKVLALDQSGRRYLVMIDLVSSLSHDVAKMAEVEALIAASVLSRYDLAVTAVYWRRDEHLGETQVQPVEVIPTPAMAEAPVSAHEVPKNSAVPVAVDEHAGSRYEPLQTEEMLAFKRALAVTGPAAAPTGAARAPARSYSPLATGYEDTQVVSPDTRPPGLGVSQYGELN